MQGVVIAALAIAWLVGSAIQLQQATLWSGGAYALAGLVACAVAGLTLWRVRRAQLSPRVTSAALVTLVAAVSMAAFAQAGWRAHQRVAAILPASLEGQELVVTGRVVGLPQVDAQGVRFIFAPDAPGEGTGTPALPKMRVAWWGAERDLGDGAGRQGGAGPRVQAGERWALPLRVRRPHGAANPHGFDAELWLFEQGIGAVASVRSGATTDALRLSGPRWWRVDEQLDAARQRWRDAALLSHSDPAIAGVLAALSVGDQSAVEGGDWALFRATGVSHLMSISGLHITLFAWLASLAVGAAWRRSARLMLWMPAPLAGRWGGVALAACYALLSGWGVPAQRTVCMLVLTVALRQWALRWPSLLVCLAAAALVVAWDPWALLQPGFWLSFAAVALLIANGTPPVTDGAVSLSARVRGLARGALRQQLVATLALAPLSLLLFQQVSLVGFVANLVAVPWVTFVVTPLALIGLLAPPVWALAGVALQPLFAFLHALAPTPAAVWQVPAAPLWAGALALFGSALLVMRLPLAARLAGLPMLLPLLWPALERPGPGRFEVLVADVGQGSAVLVRTSDHLMVYDTGPRYGQDGDAGQSVLLPLLRARGESQIDRLVVSHRDTDHAGGAASLLEGIPVEELLTSLEPAHPLRQARNAQGVPVAQQACAAGQRWQWDGVSFEVLHPSAGAWPAGATPNAVSCVLRVEDARGASVLLAGDIEAAQEQALVEQLGGRLKSSVLLVPHHGSKTSSSDAFLRAVQPEHAVAQMGYRNRFGHPHPTVLARYAAMHIPLVRTDACGAWHWDGREGVCARQARRRYWEWRSVDALNVLAGEPELPVR